MLLRALKSKLELRYSFTLESVSPELGDLSLWPGGLVCPGVPVIQDKALPPTKPSNAIKYTRRSLKASAFGMIHGGVRRIRCQAACFALLWVLESALCVRVSL